MQDSSAYTSPFPPVRPWRLAGRHVVAALFWGGFFCWLNRLTLQSSEFWGQAAFGRWILANQALPAEAPFSPLTAGMRLFDTAWLSQAAFAAVHAWGGAEALSLLLAVVVVAAHAILGRALYYRTRSLLAAHLGVLLTIALAASRIRDAQPDMFGMFCLATLLWLVIRDDAAQSESRGSAAQSGVASDADRPPTAADTVTIPQIEGGGRRFGRSRWALWIGVPVLLALWANLHGTFIWGLAILAIWVVAGAIQAVGRACGTRRIVGDRSWRSKLWLAELGVVAACVNPYGVALLLYVGWFADYRQLFDLPAWQPLALLQPGGGELVGSLLAAIVLFQFSRRRLTLCDVLLLAVFSFAFGGGTRLAWWYAAVYAVVVTPHLADVIARVARMLRERRQAGGRQAAGRWRGLPREPRVGYAVLAAGLIWISFALSPAWDWIARGRPRPPERLYGGLPWQLTQYLRENPPDGLVYNPYWWGDWLVWDGPPDLRPFLTGRLDLVSPKVWTDYRIVRETRSGWQGVLARYGVRHVVLDRYRQTTLAGFLRDSSKWRLDHEDSSSLVFTLVEGPATEDQPALGNADMQNDEGIDD